MKLNICRMSKTLRTDSKIYIFKFRTLLQTAKKTYMKNLHLGDFYQTLQTLENQGHINALINDVKYLNFT